MMGGSKVVTGEGEGGEGEGERERDLSPARRGGGRVSQTYAEELPGREGAAMAEGERGRLRRSEDNLKGISVSQAHD